MRRGRDALTRSIGVLAVLLLAVVTGDMGVSTGQVLAIAVVAIAATLASWPQRPVWLPYAVQFIEAGAATLIVVTATPGDRPSIAYLLIPPLIAAYSLGLAGLGATVATEGLVLVAGTTIRVSTDLPSAVADVIVALSLGAALGIGALMTAHIRARIAPPATDYDAARKLLTSLRDIARQLPGGLEETTLAESALERLGSVLPHDRAEVFVRAESGGLLPVARSPEGAPGWSPTLHSGLWGQAWETGAAVQRLGRMTGAEIGTSHACAVIPLRLGDKTIGLVGIERNDGLWPVESLIDAQRLADESALRLDTARLFDEVRDFATLEERRRLAREIHDGIAQEVAGLGFLLDDALSQATDQSTRDALERIRGELTRIVTELRLSIFDLRSEAGAGIGDALSSHIRAVGAESGLTVHLVLDEDASRLPPGVAPQILRIAQEAVGNARRHAEARNLWVTYRVTEGGAFLRIADDGKGIVDNRGRPNHYGLQIMRERATSIGAELTIKRRSPSGTVVELSLETAAAAAMKGELR